MSDVWLRHLSANLSWTRYPDGCGIHWYDVLCCFILGHYYSNDVFDARECQVEQSIRPSDKVKRLLASSAPRARQSYKLPSGAKTGFFHVLHSLRQGSIKPFLHRVFPIVCLQYSFQVKGGALDEGDAWLRELPDNFRNEVLMDANKDMIAKMPLFTDAGDPFIMAIVMKFQRRFILRPSHTNSWHSKPSFLFVPFFY